MNEDREHDADQRELPRPLDYASPLIHTSSEAADSLSGLAFLLGLALVIALGFSGVASDHVHFPFLKKLTITFAAVPIVALICRVGARGTAGCGMLAGLYCVVMAVVLSVMWFWN